MFDVPPASKLTPMGRLDPRRATEAEAHGEKLFFGKAQCSACHPAPFYTNHEMSDLHLERFLNEPGDGPIKNFTLRGIKESPPFLHDGRCLTHSRIRSSSSTSFWNSSFRRPKRRSFAAFLRCL